MKLFKYALLLLLLQPSILLAESSESEEIKTLIWQWIDLGIFAGILIFANFFFGNPAKKFWISRWQGIERAINSGNVAINAAKERLKKAKDNQVALKQTILDLDTKIAADTESEINHLQQYAKRQSESLISQTTIRAEIERQAGEKKAKDEMIENIILEATKRLKSLNNYEKDRSRRFATIEALQSWYDTRKVEN